MLGIRAKIVLPFTLLFLATLLAVTLLAAWATARLVDARLQAQMRDLAAVLSQAGFASNSDVLGRVKTIVGGELATVDARGAIVATTLDAEGAGALGARLAGLPRRSTPCSSRCARPSGARG